MVKNRQESDTKRRYRLLVSTLHKVYGKAEARTNINGVIRIMEGKDIRMTDYRTQAKFINWLIEPPFSWGKQVIAPLGKYNVRKRTGIFIIIPKNQIRVEQLPNTLESHALKEIVVR